MEEQKKEKPDTTIRSMTKDELRQFVLDFCDGKIFTSALIDPNRPTSLGSVFMPVALGAFEGWEEDDVRQIGLIYEYLEKAGPCSVNGYPSFFSMKLMNREDWERAIKAIQKEQERRENIEV